MNYKIDKSPLGQLKEVNDWMRRRKKRNAPSVTIEVGWGLLDKHRFFNSNERSDGIASILFDKSIMNYRLHSVTHYRDFIWLVLEKSSNTNIDSNVIEMVVQWFDGDIFKNDIGMP